MVYKFFDKKSKGSGTKHVNTKLTPQNQQLAEELHKPIIRKFEKRKVHAGFKGNIWGADLEDMQLLSKYNKALNFIILLLKNGCEIMILLCIQQIMKESLLLLKGLLER